ncbi:ImmA/IrrE family metallo-endopeptidase [Roseateles chitinivorans]|uniref:ImmA/IrrE family metallo-endopeptidase n=1 Tax=Roseateles chitinivorans TaxID=2917965 RepID=UPI003D66422B
MCRLLDLEVIVINRQEPLGRRNFDLAHELFHALTWDALKPLHREDPEEKPTGKRIKRIEQLADNFAAGLLMPRDSLEKLIPKDKFDDVQYLATIARELQVSNGALAYRLFNARMVNTTTRDALRKFPSPKDEIQRPQRFSASFVSLLHDGIARGHVSSRKAALALSLNLEELADLLREHGKPVPFAA